MTNNMHAGTDEPGRDDRINWGRPELVAGLQC